MENCPQHEALEFRVKQAEKKIELIDHQLTNLDKNEAVFNQRIADALENLSALPNAIDRLNKSTTEMKFREPLNKSPSFSAERENRRLPLGSSDSVGK